MMSRKWIVISAVLIVIGGFVVFASVSERAAEGKAKSFCAQFKAGDDFESAIALMNSTPSTDKWINAGNRLSIMFSSYDPQSVYACEIGSRDGKITDLRYRHLAQD